MGVPLVFGPPVLLSVPVTVSMKTKFAYTVVCFPFFSPIPFVLATVYGSIHTSEEQEYGKDNDISL
jgi:hypothetical protein